MSYSFRMQSCLRRIHHYFIACWSESLLGLWIKYFLGCNSHKHVVRIKCKNVSSTARLSVFVISTLTCYVRVSCSPLCFYRITSSTIFAILWEVYGCFWLWSADGIFVSELFSNIVLNFSWSVHKRTFCASVMFYVWEEQDSSHTNCLMYIPGTGFDSWT